MSQLAPTARIFCTAALLLLAVGCVSTRVTPSMPCASNQHCPADGQWTCNLVSGECEHCVGSCPGTTSDAVDGATSVTPTDAGGSSDASSTVTDASASDSADTTDSTDSTDATASITSCSGKCGKYVADDVCFCDDFCSENGDCCADYAEFCVSADAGTSDTAGADDMASSDDTASSDAGAVDASEDVSATGK